MVSGRFLPRLPACRCANRPNSTNLVLVGSRVICERFHKTVLNEFYRVAFRKKVYRPIDELQADLDSWVAEYNEARPHQGRWCFGKTPMQTFLDAMPMTMIAA